MTGQATAAYIPGAAGVSIAGINDDGSAILLEIDARAASILSLQLERAAAELTAAADRVPMPHHTTDHPLPDFVGQQGE